MVKKISHKLEPKTKKKEQEPLIDRMAILDAIANVVKEAFFLVDQDRKIMWANNGFLDLVGMTNEQVINRKCFGVFPDSTQSCNNSPICPLPEVFAKLKPTCTIHAYLNRFGEERKFKVYSYPMKDKSSIYAMEVLQDVTAEMDAHAKMKESQEKYESLFRCINDPVAVFDHEGNLIHFNDYLVKMFAYNRKELKDKKFEDFIHPDNLKEAVERFKSQVECEPQERIFVVRALNKQRDMFFLEISMHPYVENENLAGVEVIMRDVTKQRKAIESLKDSEAMFRALFEQSNDAVLILTTDGKILDVNLRAVELLGYSESKLLKMTLHDLSLPDQYGEFARTLKAVKEQDSVRFECQVLTANGTVIPVDVSARLLDYKGQELTQAIFRDMTERKRWEEEIRQLSITDNLTGLYNQRFFYEKLEQEVARAKRHEGDLTLLMVDLDGFKILNDTRGHLAGDKILQKIGGLIQKCLRMNDSAFRYGGDEFCLILPDTAIGGAVTVAERLQSLIHRELRSYRITLSIGVVKFQPRYNTKAFIHYADQSLYVAKSSGGDRYFILPG